MTTPVMYIGDDAKVDIIFMLVFFKTVDLRNEQNVTVPYSVFMSCIIPS